MARERKRLKKRKTRDEDNDKEGREEKKVGEED